MNKTVAKNYPFTDYQMAQDRCCYFFGVPDYDVGSLRWSLKKHLESGLIYQIIHLAQL